MPRAAVRPPARPAPAAAPASAAGLPARKGQKWQFETDIAPLLEALAPVLAERAFVVLSTYAIGTSPLTLENLLSAFDGGQVEAGELVLEEREAGRLLPAGFCARWRRGFGDG